MVGTTSRASRDFSRFRFGGRTEVEVYDLADGGWTVELVEAIAVLKPFVGKEDFASVILSSSAIEAQNGFAGCLVQTPEQVGCVVGFQGLANAVKLGGTPKEVVKNTLKLQSPDGAVISIPVAKAMTFPPAALPIGEGTELTEAQLRILQAVAAVSDEVASSSPIGSVVYGDSHWVIGGTSVCIVAAYLPLCPTPMVIPATFFGGIQAGQVVTGDSRFAVRSGDVVAWTRTLDTAFPVQAVGDVVQGTRAGGRARFRLAVDALDGLAKALKALQLAPADSCRFTGQGSTITFLGGRDDVASYRTTIKVDEGSFDGSIVLSWRSLAALVRVVKSTAQETVGFSVGAAAMEPVAALCLGDVPVELVLAQMGV